MKKTSLFTLSIVALLLLLAGCRGSGPGGDETRPTPISEAPAAEGGGGADEGGGVGQAIALRLWLPQDEAARAALQAAADAYSAATPGVTVTMETIDPATYDQTTRDALNAGTAADILALPATVVCGLSGLLAAAPAGVVAAAAALDQATLAPFQCDGALYGLPIAAAPGGLAVSRAAAPDVAWDFVRFVALQPQN
jgi:ABC-type glycerol-3-phosphate transport system substrate-binding protein